MKDNAVALIRRIAGIVRHSADFARVVPVPRARCPVVKFVHAASSISCDISINNRFAVALDSLALLYSDVSAIGDELTEVNIHR